MFAALLPSSRASFQTLTVWVCMDARDLAKTAAETAVALAGAATMEEIEGSQKWESPSGQELNAIFLKPIPITRDNLNVVVDAGWITKDELCQNVPANTVKACN